MIPKRVELENFLSFGSPAAEIVFADDEPLWVLGGPNGVGKSAVFDAITYCLFGEHRGGKQKADQLIHHGANGFQVAFEFEFDGADYRVTKTRGGRTTQRVEQRDAAGAWKPVAGVNSAADVDAWAERTLGLGYDAFQASVLLRQGEADKILTAGPTERGTTLRKIIGADRYRDLGERVHAAAKRCKGRLDDRQTRLDGLPDASAEAVAEAEARRVQAEADRATANQAANDADRRVTEAKQWDGLDRKMHAVAQQLLDADTRADHATHIRTDKARLDDLIATVPLLQKVITLRAGLTTAEHALFDHQSAADRVAAAIRALDWKQEVADVDAFIKAVDAAAAFPADLVEQVSAAQAAANLKTQLLTDAGKERAAAEALRKQAKERRTEFAKVGVGVKCSRCGQEVTEEHAQTELADIDRSVRDLDGKCAGALAIEQQAVGAKTEADDHLNTTTAQQERQRAATGRLTELTQTRAERGLSTDRDELRRTLPERRQALKQAEADAGDQAGVDRKALMNWQTDITGRLNAARTALSTNQVKVDLLIDQLASTWRSRLDGLDADAVQALDAERTGYVTARVAEQARQLELDAAQRGVWVQQRDDLAAEIALIPEASRVPVADAERDAAAARQTATTADRTRDAARTSADQLARQAADHQAAVTEVATAERENRLHQKLDGLLGKDGLQRELVRSAELEIVRLADDTVRQLSDGDLTVELAAGPNAKDDEFDLRVRRADDPTPIGVHYLSGSQKFRVAVAVALAIGRYAAGQARPLESVIIDEGFGSLDRDGLAAMADELNRLKRYLRRIVLVSHQEEFADRFPVVIKLSRGDHGTVAEAVRR